MMRTLLKQALHVASVAALVVGCGGSDKNQQARAPSTDTTQTTGSSMQPQDQQMQQPQGYTFDQSQSGMDQSGMTGGIGGGTTGGGTGTGIDNSGIPGGTGTGDTSTMGQGSGTSADQGSTGTGSGSTKAKTERALNDSEIFAVETAANEGEIQMAEIARKSARSAQVKNFAGMMVTEHRNAQNKAKQIASKAKITASDNEVSNQLKSDVSSMVSDLKTQKGADFDKAYIDDQVKAHRSVLDIVDNRLLPNVSDSDLKSHLTDVRSKVADHLSKAEDIQTKLGQQPVGQVGAKTGSDTGKSMNHDTTDKTKGKGTTKTKPGSDTNKDNSPKGGDTTPKSDKDTTDQGGAGNRY